jgi:hypothetical protein
MEHQGRGLSGVSEGRFIRLPGGKKTPVYTDTGGRLGTVEWFAVDPLEGRIALVMIVSRRFGLFAAKRLALPWNALSVEADSGRLVVRTEEGLDQGIGARSAPALRRDPSRVEPL